MDELWTTESQSHLVAVLRVTTDLDATVADIDAAARMDARAALTLARRCLEQRPVRLLDVGDDVVLATARIPRRLEQQRAARAAWVQLANAVRAELELRPHRHPAVHARVHIRFEG